MQYVQAKKDSLYLFIHLQACHVNLKIDAETCDQLNNVRYKEICTLIQNTESQILVTNVSDTNSLEEVFKIVRDEGRDDVELDELRKVLLVCNAERDSQKLISKTYSIRAPIGTDFLS